MMSNADIKLVQSLYDAFKRGDIGTIVRALSPDVAWESTGRQKDHPALGPRRGPAAVQDFFRIVSETQDVVSFEPKEFSSVDGKVFVLGHYAWTLKKTARQMESDWIHIFTISNGKVTAFREFTDTAALAEAYRG
jgi:ketosteroid isomerase-like protein